MSDHILYFSTWHSCIQICDGTSPTWNDSGFAKVASSLLQANAMVDYRNELVMNASALVQSSQQGHLDAWMYQNRKFVHWWTWVQLPYLCVLNKKSGDFWFTASNRVFFFGFRRWSKPFWQQMLQWTSPEVTEQLLSFWLHRSGVDGSDGLVDLVGPKVGRWGVTWKSLAGKFSFLMILEETSGPNIVQND